MKWKDGSSYSQQKPRGTRKPNVWEIQTDNLRITVVYGHIYYPDEWIMSCRELDMKRRILKATTAEQAKKEAIKMISDEFNKLKSEIDNLLINRF